MGTAGVYWLVFDVDGMRSAARQRSLPKTADLPAAARRMDKVCAPGYSWGDWSRTQNRWAWLELLRSQTVTVMLFPKQPSPHGVPDSPYSRPQRAHWRLSWSQRLARNTAPANQAQAHIHLFGIPPTVSKTLNLAVA